MSLRQPASRRYSATAAAGQKLLFHPPTNALYVLDPVGDLTRVDRASGTRTTLATGVTAVAAGPNGAAKPNTVFVLKADGTLSEFGARQAAGDTVDGDVLAIAQDVVAGVPSVYALSADGTVGRYAASGYTTADRPTAFRVRGDLIVVGTAAAGIRETRAVYERGVRLTAAAFRPIADRLTRSLTLPKWSVTIQPQEPGGQNPAHA